MIVGFEICLSSRLMFRLKIARNLLEWLICAGLDTEVRLMVEKGKMNAIAELLPQILDVILQFKQGFRHFSYTY